MEGRRRSLPLAGPSLLAARDVDRRQRPIYAVWEVTLRCDLACLHCGSRAGHARPDELSTAEALDLVAQLAALGVREVTMIGGEAYLRDDWCEIARAIARAGMRCTMTTGGRNLTAARAREAQRAGVSAISVSVDGLEATHDRLRGRAGSHAAAMAALTHVAAVGMAPCANTQIGRANLHEIEATFDALAAAGIRAWQVQLTVPMGRAADHPELLLEPYHMLEVLPLLARLKARADAAGVQLAAGNNIGYFGPHESTLRGHLPCGHQGACGAGSSTLGIEADGTIKGCPSLPTAGYAGGSVRHHPLRTILEQAAPLRRIRDRTVDDLWGFCRTCYYAESCMAGCTWTADVTLGRPGNNPFCHHRALELARRGQRERLVQVERPPGVPFDQGRFEIVLEPCPTEV